MKEYRKRIAETIVTAREMADVSQRQLAGLLGRDRRTIQKWESGEIRLLVEDYLGIFDVLNVNLELFSKWLRHPELFPNGLGDIQHLSSDRKRAGRSPPIMPTVRHPWRSSRNFICSLATTAATAAECCRRSLQICRRP